MPESLMEVWIWFKRLSNRRQSGMGVNPISFQEIESFFNLQGFYPEPEEVALIEAFDNLTVSHYNKKQSEASKQNKNPVKGRK